MSVASVASVRIVSERLLVCLLSVVVLLLILFVVLMSSDRIVTLPVILLFGSLGAFVSLQRRLKDLTEEDLTLFRESIAYTLLAPVAGAVMAGVLYLLLISGLLGGQLFPVFDADNPSTTSAIGIAKLFQAEAAGAADYAKLLFWCFVAGFSERFVTDIIGRFSDQATNSLPQGSGR
jgi:hypothetical protein